MNSLRSRSLVTALKPGDTLGKTGFPVADLLNKNGQRHFRQRDKNALTL
ncbi:MAG: hypothetical protein U1D30_23335 [Planctomycetota bacterium]